MPFGIADRVWPCAGEAGTGRPLGAENASIQFQTEWGSVFAQRMLNREAIAVASPAAFLEARRRGDIEYFRLMMEPLVRQYDGGRLTTSWRRTAARLVRKLPPRGEALVRRVMRGTRFS